MMPPLSQERLRFFRNEIIGWEEGLGQKFNHQQASFDAEVVMDKSGNTR